MTKIFVSTTGAAVTLTGDGLPHIAAGTVNLELTKYATYNAVTANASYISAISARTLLARDEFGGLLYSNVQGGVSGSFAVSANQDASANPNYPAGLVGQVLKITVAGKVGGASGKVVQVGDLVLCLADNAGGAEASVGTSWLVIQGNVTQATESAVGYVELATQAEVNTGTDAERVVTPATLKANLGSRGGTITVKKTIGFPGDTGKDFTFTSAANQTEQNIDLGSIIPAKARILDAVVICDQTVAGGATIDLALGTASSGEQLAVNANCDAANDIVATATGGSPVAAINAAASKVWLQGTIAAANWSTVSAGRWSVYVTYIDNAKLD